MKYYSLKYKDRIKDGFGGYAKMWKIEILEKYRYDKGLLEHEKVHVKVWYACMLLTFAIAGALYVFVDPLLGWTALLGPFANGVAIQPKWAKKIHEAYAYRVQLKHGNYRSPQFAIDALMNKYGLGLSEKEARKALRL